MNALTIALLSVLGTLLIGGVAAGVVLAQIRSRKNAEDDRRLAGELVRLAGELTVALGLHSKSIDQYSESIKNTPKLVEGIGKMAAAQVVEIQLLRKQIQALKDSIFRRDMERVDVPGDTEKDFAWRAKEMMAESPGLTMSEALQKVVEEEASRITSPGGFDLG
jgi:hypothetical protein